MNKIATRLLALRSAMRLSIEQLAEQVDVSAPTLREVEEGSAILSPSVIERCALLQGLTADEWLRGVKGDEAPVALLRSAAQSGRLRALHEDRIPMCSGEVLLVARLVKQIEAACEITRAQLPTIARSSATVDMHPAEGDAQRAREALGIGDEPIVSMRAVLERHGVLIVWTDEDEVPETLEGLSLLGPIPTILANLRHGREKHWHTRMTLAHELGHLLFDHLRRGVALTHSPRIGHTPALPGIADIERDANAFAACLLAPASLVRRQVGSHAPYSDAAVVAVGRGLGVGRTVAINRIQHVFGLSANERSDMEQRVTRYDALGREDIPRASEVGIRRGVLRQRVVEALNRGLLSRERAWSLLKLAPEESLPDASTEGLRAPLISEPQRLLRLALNSMPKDSLWSPVDAERVEAGRWRITLLRGTGALPQDTASMTITEHGEVVDRSDSLIRSLP